MKSTEQYAVSPPLLARSEGRARYEVYASESEDLKPSQPETLRHRHQIQSRQTRARRVIHHRRTK